MSGFGPENVNVTVFVDWNWMKKIKSKKKKSTAKQKNFSLLILNKSKSIEIKANQSNNWIINNNKQLIFDFDFLSFHSQNKKNKTYLGRKSPKVL